MSEVEGDAGVEVDVERELGLGDLDVAGSLEGERRGQLVEKAAAHLGQRGPRHDGVDAGLAAGRAAVVIGAEGDDVADLPAAEPGRDERAKALRAEEERRLEK